MRNPNRDQLLKTLRERQLVKELPSEHAPVVELLDDRIELLREVLGVGIDVKADALLEELSRIGAFSTEVEALRQVIRSIHFPDVPDSVELTGVDGLRAALDKHARYMAELKDYKLPDAKVLVDVTDNQRIEEVTSRLDTLIRAITDAAAPADQSPTAFVPYRRVRKIGNRLVFDDDAHTGGWGGGSNNQTQSSNTITQANAGFADSTSAIYDGQAALTPKFALISANDGGTNIILTAVTSKCLRILSYVIISNGLTNLTWQSDLTDISGAMALTENTGVSSGYMPLGHFQTTVSEGLNINLSSAAEIGGHMTYIEVDG